MATFYEWGSIVLRLHSHCEDSLLFTTKSPGSFWYSFDRHRKDDRLGWQVESTLEPPQNFLWLKTLQILNPFHDTSLIPYPLKTSEKQSFNDIFRGYRKRSVARNQLMGIPLNRLQSTLTIPKNMTSVSLSSYHTKKDILIYSNFHLYDKTSCIYFHSRF